MSNLLQSILAWALAALAAYGYRIVFVFTVLENIFVVGSFTPGDVITASAAVAATTVEGARLSPWLIFLVATIGTMVGTNISYLLGRIGGRDLIERIGPRFGIGKDSIEATEEYFNTHGASTVFFARFVAVLKNVAPSVAGALRMNMLLFEVYSLMSAVVYSAALVALGWFLGENFRVGLKYFGFVSWGLLLVVIGAGVWLWRRKRAHDARLMAENAAAYEQECEDAQGEEPACGAEETAGDDSDGGER